MVHDNLDPSIHAFTIRLPDLRIYVMMGNNKLEVSQLQLVREHPVLLRYPAITSTWLKFGVIATLTNVQLTDDDPCASTSLFQPLHLIQKAKSVVHYTIRNSSERHWQYAAEETSLPTVTIKRDNTKPIYYASVLLRVCKVKLSQKEIFFAKGLFDHTRRGDSDLLLRPS